MVPSIFWLPPSVSMWATGMAPPSTNWIAWNVGSVRLTQTQPLSDLQVTMGIGGQYRIKVAQHVAKGVNASMLTPAATTLLYVPLSIGADGTAMGSFSILSIPHIFTVLQYGWTGRPVTFTGLTSKGLPMPDAVAEGSFFPPFDGQGGQITLVAPTRIHIDGPLAQRRSASFTYLSMAFDVGDPTTGVNCVPEPGAAALLLAAFASTVLSARRRRAA